MHIIDTHCHIYPDAIAERAAAGIGKFYDYPVWADGRVDTLLKAGAAAGISHHVVCSVATTPHQVASINRFIRQTVDAHPDRFTGLGALHPDSPDQAADVEQVLSLGLIPSLYESVFILSNIIFSLALLVINSPLNPFGINEGKHPIWSKCE